MNLQHPTLAVEQQRQRYGCIAARVERFQASLVGDVDGIRNLRLPHVLPDVLGGIEIDADTDEVDPGFWSNVDHGKSSTTVFSPGS